MNKRLLTLLIGLIVIGLAITIYFNRFHTIPLEQGDLLKVHFIDVGQGDATLLQGPDFTILIDTGRHDRNDVLPYLRSQNIREIDLLVGTHPHADHIGQFPQILENFQVDEVWMSGDLHTTRSFENALDAIENTEAHYNEPKAFEKYSFGSAQIEIIHPKNITGDLNNGSIVLRLHYENLIFLFTGDAELNAEQEILERGHDVKADILKIGHHGSNSSTSELFLEKIDPEVAIYSVAIDNSYGHPHPNVIDRLKRRGVDIYGTDLFGTIVLITDGNRYDIDVSRRAELVEFAVISDDNSCIDINSAYRDELINIVNIGSARADELIQLRPFTSLEQLGLINGISHHRLTEIIAEGKACMNETE